MQKRKEKNTAAGITLIALMVIIIILLILAGISIGVLTGKNGLIKNAGKAKEQTEINNEKEVIDICTVQTMGKNKYGNITKNSLQEELDHYTGDEKTEVLEDENNLYVYFVDTNRYYTVNNDRNVEGPVKVARAIDKYPGDITKDKDGNKLSGLTEADAFQINCIEDLCAFSNSVNNGTTYQNKYVVLMVDLDFKSDLSYINGYINIEGEIASCDSIGELREILTTEIGFYSIAGIGNSNFKGIFNGNYYTISNLYENSEVKGGLFGSCWNAIIKNLTVEGEIKSSNSAAGISAYIRSTTIINCINKANITGEGGSVGGIAGYTYSGSCTIKNCANYGEIKGGNFNAGILGWDWSTDSKIYNCLNANKASAGIVRNIYSGDSIEVINTSNFGECSTVVAGSISKVRNSFYLSGSATSAGDTEIVEYDKDKIKSEDFVKKLNTFIELGGRDSEIDTTGWTKWIYHENEFPTLDLKTTWNGAEWEYGDG